MPKRWVQNIFSYLCSRGSWTVVHLILSSRTGCRDLYVVCRVWGVPGAVVHKSLAVGMHGVPSVGICWEVVKVYMSLGISHCFLSLSSVAFRWPDAPSMPIFLNIFGVEILDWNFWEVPPKNWKARFSYHSFFLLWSKSQIGDATFSTELCWLGGKMTGVKWNWSFCPFHATNLRFCAPPEMVIAAMKLKDAYSLDRKLWPN